jgi:hypothetical protein
MLAARNCKDILDLSVSLQDIYIEERHLNFGQAKFIYSEIEDNLDQCIAANPFKSLIH